MYVVIRKHWVLNIIFGSSSFGDVDMYWTHVRLDCRLSPKIFCLKIIAHVSKVCLAFFLGADSRHG